MKIKIQFGIGMLLIQFGQGLARIEIFRKISFGLVQKGLSLLILSLDTFADETGIKKARIRFGKHGKVTYESTE